MTSRSAAYALYSRSYEYLDGIEDVSLTPAVDGQATVTGVKALRGDLRRETLQGGVLKLEPATIEFRLWDATLDGAAPVGGDLIADSSGDRFRIVTVQRQMWDTQWLCVCQPEI